jgi:hypothetical protein
LKRFFAATFCSIALLIAAFLTFGWNALSLEKRHPFPLPLLELMYILLGVGFAVEQTLGYYKDNADPSWWHPTFLISTATVFWSFLCAIVITALRAVYRLTHRVIRGTGQV